MARTAPKLRIASADGEPELKITNADWRRIEEAYGHRLSDDVRRRIFEATMAFLYFEIFERTAEPRQWAKDRVERVRLAASRFHTALFERPRRGRDAHVFANSLITRHFADSALKEGDVFRNLGGVLLSFSAACNLANKENRRSGHAGPPRRGMLESMDSPAHEHRQRARNAEHRAQRY